MPEMFSGSGSNTAELSQIQARKKRTSKVLRSGSTDQFFREVDERGVTQCNGLESSECDLHSAQTSLRLVSTM